MSMKPLNWVGPWKGIITDVPSGFDMQSFDRAQNWVFRKGRLQTRPPLVPYVATAPDNKRVLALYSFLDVLSNWHTLVLTSDTAYFITSDGTGGIVFNELTLPDGLGTLGGSNLPFALIEMNQQVYFSNGAQPLLYVDGSDTVYLAGDVPGGCQFLTENSGHLIGANWIIPPVGVVGSTKYPFYVVYSDVGNPQSWTPGLATSAGIINLIEKGGVPSGLTTLGAYTYVWRQFGANVLWPTGNAGAPFYNEPFTWSNPGWGSFYPYAIATWNNRAFLVSHNGEVLAFAGSTGASEEGFTPLAEGKVKSQIAADLLLADDTVLGFVTDQLSPPFDYQAYVLWIPGPNRGWVLHLTDMTWTTFTSARNFPTAFGNIKVH